MKANISLRDISPNPKQGLYSANHIQSGIPIPKTKRIELLSSDEWEEFTEEWASSLKPNYYKVRRFAGSGDKGLDVVGFIKDDTFEGGWDNYQCKRYKDPLTPSVIWIEIGKIIYYTFKSEFPLPRKYYFIGSKGIGTKLGQLIASPEKLKIECRNNWSNYCEKELLKKFAVTLDGDLYDHFNNFDFSIFSSKTLLELITGHSNTPFHTVRFGGGLPLRPKPDDPPSEITITESRYIEQIYEAYSDHTGKLINDVKLLEKLPKLKEDFLRQRERFYRAESLRNFARDNVPSGTFEELQENLYHGVIETCESEHNDGLKRMRATLTAASQAQLSSGPLATVTEVKDKQGICHQLSNDNRLIWVPNK